MALLARPDSVTSAVPAAAPVVVVARSRVRFAWLAAGVAFVAVAVVAGVSFGPVSLPFEDVVRELLWFDSSLTDTERNILWEIRLPRVVLGLVVGATLAISGASFFILLMEA